MRSYDQAATLNIQRDLCAVLAISSIHLSMCVTSARLFVKVRPSVAQKELEFYLDWNKEFGSFQLDAEEAHGD